jgi:hypothetical protein
MAFRSVVSVLGSVVVRSFSTNSRPALRAGNDTTATGATGLTHHSRQNRSLRRFRWLILGSRVLRFPFSLLPKGQLPQLPRPPSMVAGIGGPIRMAEPLLHLGRLLVALDRPLIGGQLPAFGLPSPLACAPRPPLGLLGPYHRLRALAVTPHGPFPGVSQPTKSTHPMMATRCPFGKVRAGVVPQPMSFLSQWGHSEIQLKASPGVTATGRPSVTPG